MAASERDEEARARWRGKNATLLASMGPEGVGPCVAVEGATNAGGARPTSSGPSPRPALRPEQVLVLDNLNAHKGERVRDLVRARGCELLFLPAYPPDFSPVDEAFLKIKARFRRQ